VEIMTADGPKIERRGLLLVLSSPSGAGKTTLARRHIEADRGISMSVSVTTRAPVEAAVVKGHDILFDIDWQGAQQLSETMKHDVVRVFVLPPSAAALEERLRARAQDPEKVVRKRMAAASAEISHWPEYDYVIVNANLDSSMAGLSAILIAERLKRERLDGLSAFVRDMQKSL
jgi:guanylate kinase